MAVATNARPRSNEERSGPLTPYRVLELTAGGSGYAGRLLADLGAEVIKVEPPGGDPVRRRGPFVDGVPDPEASLQFLHQNVGKRSVVIDLESVDGQVAFRDLASGASIVIESLPVGYLESLGLGWQALHALNSRLIMASVTPFGQTGPHASWHSTPITAFAMSGAMQVAGWPEFPPCNAPHAMVEEAGAMFVVIGVLASLRHLGETGQGQYIDVSEQEAGISALFPWAVPNYSYATTGASSAFPAVAERGAHAYMFYETADGYVRLLPNTSRQWEALRRALGDPSELAEDEWQTSLFRRQQALELNEIISVYTRRMTTAELVQMCQGEGCPATPIQPPSRFLDDPNADARGFWVELDHPKAGRATYPGTPYRLRQAPLRISKPAPLLGEGTDDIIGTRGRRLSTATNKEQAS